ncbi:NAD(P)-binding protein [Aspergillus pseudonomiae]|uniref:NAD(P)-binding protein n=1 Tax=Aspergillus pseudonomiae TaxID=1506151 RepID=A0A5N6IDS4_9EURO|nr:NAD(P)-binding protein [Aspergillus pseudonomiae]KAB8264257.1 NAD(P)-binding protein [Aspergillus pseudonomiae]KAE8409104.1 NAD(P)-binding protein [Aspergillus pseudonomiae]
MCRIVITGATGDISGDVLGALTQAFRSCKITALVRSKKKASLITGRFPSVTPVIRNVDSAAEIASEASEASEADVGLYLASSNHLPSATAIAQGLTETKRQSLVRIQISGANLLSGAEVATSSDGQARAPNHNDLQGISGIRIIISSSPKRAVDQMLLNSSSEQPNLRTAILYGPLIYGLGRGPVNQRSIQLPELAKATSQLGHGVQVGKGLSCWSNIHIADLSTLIMRLAPETEVRQGGNPLLWRENGIYFAENGKMPFGESSRRVAAFAFQNGFTKSTYV